MFFLLGSHLEGRRGMDADFGLFPAVTLVTAQRPDGAVRGRLALLLQEGVERPCVRWRGKTVKKKSEVNATGKA